MKKITFLITAIAISFSPLASANNLAVYKAVINSQKLAKKLANLQGNQNAHFVIERIETTATYRCMGCYALTIELRGLPLDGRDIILTKTLKATTKGNPQNKIVVNSITEVTE